jgi:hypothetical protein
VGCMYVRIRTGAGSLRSIPEHGLVKWFRHLRSSLCRWNNAFCRFALGRTSALGLESRTLEHADLGPFSAAQINNVDVTSSRILGSVGRGLGCGL